MKLDEIKKAVSGEKYNFLHENRHLGDNIILLGLGGSHAYGTETDTSDLDIRGCALNSREEILCGESFEQVIDNATDTTIYSFKKLIRLLTDCNPNTIEILGLKPEHYLYLSDTGKQLIDNRRMFLSKKAVIGRHTVFVKKSAVSDIHKQIMFSFTVCNNFVFFEYINLSKRLIYTASKNL